MKIVITHVDFDTRIPCTVEPMRTGPAFPDLAGWSFEWADESNWPMACVNGVYQTAPRYYGTCSDTADISVPGVLAVLSDAEYFRLKTAEHQARRPYPSWIGDEQTMTWRAPVPRPTGRGYQWDESTQNWIVI
jgi:hypothetical protein